MQTKGHDCKLKLLLRILYVYCLLLRGACHEPLQRSRVVKKLAAPIFSSRSSMLEIRYTSNSKMAFSFLKSMHIRSEPSFLDTTKSVFHHLELECLMTLSSTILITVASLPALICVVLFVPFYNHTLHTQTHTQLIFILFVSLAFSSFFKHVKSKTSFASPFICYGIEPVVTF